MIIFTWNLYGYYARRYQWRLAGDDPFAGKVFSVAQFRQALVPPEWVAWGTQLRLGMKCLEVASNSPGITLPEGFGQQTSVMINPTLPFALRM